MPGDPNVPEALEYLKETLHRLDKRWKVAGLWSVELDIRKLTDDAFRRISEDIGDDLISKIFYQLTRW